MSSLLNKIKSKYSLRNIMNFIPFNKSLGLILGSSKLMSKLNITKEVYKKFNDIKKILNPFYDVNKYFSYLDIKPENQSESNCIINEENNLEKILYGCLCCSPFNYNLFIGNKGWEFVIKNINKVKLIITPKIVNYLLEELGNEEKEKVFNLLNFYKRNIVEISFCYFFNEMKMNFEIINKIINVLQKIFENKEIIVENENNNNQNTINEKIININHNVKKIGFESCAISIYIDITSKFLDKIDNILCLKKVEGITIDSSQFNEYQFSEIIQFFSKKMDLKNIKINDFGIFNSHYADLNFICNNPKEQIEYIDLSQSFCLSSVLPILNYKIYPLKEIKLKIYSNKNNADWNFLYMSLNSLENFELELKEINSQNLYSLINILNKMIVLKSLAIIGGISFNQLIIFHNYANLESLNIDLIINEDIKDFFDLSHLKCKYFSNFKNLKYLTISTNNSLIENNLSNSNILLLPPKLIGLRFKNIEGSYILSLLKKNCLNDIEELKIENSNFIFEDFKNLVNFISSFKYLIKLALNKINIPLINFGFSEKLNLKFYQQIPLIFKNAPLLIELDISNNEYNEKMLKSNIFEEIRMAIPKNLLSFKIFNSEIDISSKCFTFLVESFGLVLDLTNNYPKINKDLDLLARFNDSNDLDSDKSSLSDIIMGEYNISDISEDEE